jgi:hypothetical protein
VWVSENPHVTCEHERDSHKVYVFYTISNKNVYGPFFIKNIVTGMSYLDTLMNWVMPQLHDDSHDFISQQNGAPAHVHLDTRHYLNANLPQRWIGRAANVDLPLLRCPPPPRSPDLTPCDFFLWGYVKDAVFVPPLPADIDDLKRSITEAVAAVACDTLRRVWEELDYRLDIGRVEHGAHIECL